MLVALLGSLGLAIAGAVLLDRADPRVRYPDQVSREMGLPILGALPHFKGRRDGLGGGGGGKWRGPGEGGAEGGGGWRRTSLGGVVASGAGGGGGGWIMR